MTIALRKADLDFETSSPIAQLPDPRVIKPASQEPKLLPATSIHPIAVSVPIAVAAWFVIVAWCAFGGGETSPVLAVVTLFFFIFSGVFVGGAAMGRNMTPERAHDRSFQAFLDGDVDIATGRIIGREALWQIAAMPVGLAIGFTIIAMIAVSV